MSLFLLWGPPFTSGDGPKMVHFGPIMAKHSPSGSSWAQMGPAGPKRVPNGQNTWIDHFGPLWNVSRPAMFGHFWIYRGKRKQIFGVEQVFGKKYLIIKEEVTFWYCWQPMTNWKTQIMTLIKVINKRSNQIAIFRSFWAIRNPFCSCPICE